MPQNDPINNTFISGRRMGKTQYMKQELARRLTEMKPGQKAIILSNDDSVIITRNPDQIEHKP